MIQRGMLFPIVLALGNMPLAIVNWCYGFKPFVVFNAVIVVFAISAAFNNGQIKAYRDELDAE